MLFLEQRQDLRRAEIAESRETRLREEAERRQSLTRADLLINQQQFQEADQLLTTLNPTEPSIEGAEAARALGLWHMENHRWTEAAERFALLLRVDQMLSSDTVSFDALERAGALIERSDWESFAVLRDDVITRFSKLTDPMAAERTIKIASLRPGDDLMRASLAPLVHTAIAAFDKPGPRTADDSFRDAWRAVSIALFEYREGDFGESVQWAQRCLASPDQNYCRGATAHVILAMAQHQLGHDNDARNERGFKPAEPSKPKPTATLTRAIRRMATGSIGSSPGSCSRRR